MVPDICGHRTKSAQQEPVELSFDKAMSKKAVPRVVECDCLDRVEGVLKPCATCALLRVVYAVSMAKCNAPLLCALTA
jgi:hypothetical protein